MTALLLALLMQPVSIDSLWKKVALTGRVIEQGDRESARISPPREISPGQAPILEFRYLEGKLRHRFGDSGLVLDDAGH